LEFNRNFILYPLECLGEVQLWKLYLEALADTEHKEKNSMVKGLRDCIYMGWWL